MKKTKGEVDL